MRSACVLVIETEKLEVHSPTELLFMVKRLSVKISSVGADADTIFLYNLWDLTRNLSTVKRATMLF